MHCDGHQIADCLLKKVLLTATQPSGSVLVLHVQHFGSCKKRVIQREHNLLYSCTWKEKSAWLRRRKGFWFRIDRPNITHFYHTEQVRDINPRYTMGKERTINTNFGVLVIQYQFVCDAQRVALSPIQKRHQLLAQDWCAKI